MFQFPGYLSLGLSFSSEDDIAFSMPGSPIRTSACLRFLTARRRFSQFGASFFSFEWPGILRTPLPTWSVGSLVSSLCFLQDFSSFDENCYFFNCFSVLSSTTCFQDLFSSYLLCLFFQICVWWFSKIDFCLRFVQRSYNLTFESLSVNKYFIFF